METLVSGHGLIEGPRVDAQGNLFFSDVPNGGVYQRTREGKVSTVVPRRRGVGGIALHAEGGLVISGRNMDKTTIKKVSGSVKAKGHGVAHQMSTTAHDGANANMSGSQLEPSQTHVSVGP